MIAIVYVLCVGAPFAHASNLHPFAPFGVRGIFSAASVVFFAFVGFDSVATVAEEVYNLAEKACPLLRIVVRNHPVMLASAILSWVFKTDQETCIVHVDVDCHCISIT